METFNFFVMWLSSPMIVVGLAVLVAFLVILNIKFDIRDLRRKRKLPLEMSQFEALGDIPFERQNLMNKTEFRVFAIVENLLARRAHGYRVMAQTSLGEVLRTGRGAPVAAARKAYAVINAKRLDIAIIDRSGFLVLAIEVQGGGHYQAPSTFIRDAVKKESLRRAGVELLEVTPDLDADRIEQEVSRRLKLAVAA